MLIVIITNAISLFTRKIMCEIIVIEFLKKETLGIPGYTLISINLRVDAYIQEICSLPAIRNNGKVCESMNGIL